MITKKQHEFDNEEEKIAIGKVEKDRTAILVVPAGFSSAIITTLCLLALVLFLLFLLTLTSSFPVWKPYLEMVLNVAS